MKVNFASYTFWVALTGAVVILIEVLADAFGFSVNSETFESIIFAICGILVVLGIIQKPANDIKDDLPTEDAPDDNDDENSGIEL